MRGGGIERLSRAKRKRQHALCPIHTMQCVNPDQAAHWRLTRFDRTSGEITCRSTENGKFRAWTEPYGARAYPSKGDERPNRCLSAESNQDEIDQRDQGCPDTGADQGVVGADIALRIERCLVGFPGHFGGLGQAGRTFCEADHIWRFFFNCMVIGNGLVTFGLVTARFADRQGTGDGSASSAMAIGERRKIMAVDVGRHHGKNLAPGISRGALRSIGTGCCERAAGAPGVSLSALRLSFQPAELAFRRLAPFIRPQFAAAAAGLARSRAVSLPRARRNPASSAPHPVVW